MKDLYALGEMPPLGQVPAQMHAQLIRQDRFGEPNKAFREEVVDVPAELKPDEVLVWVMAAGINYNNVWAGLGSPVDVIAARKKDKDFGDDLPFHIGGSDASGIVWKTGSAVTQLKVGDRVIGVIAIYSLMEQKKKKLTWVDFELFSLLAGHAATAIFSSKLHSQSERRLSTIQGFIDLLSGRVKS